MSESAKLVAFAGQVLSIMVIDLTLSGDNAAVIGLAIRDLPAPVARKAAVIGAAGAVALRVMFTSGATKLTTIPYLSAVGAVLLAGITVKLMMPGGEQQSSVKTASHLWAAVWAIVIADLSMALDNVLAVAGAAHGNMGLVLFGLGFSIPILVWGSTWVGSMMHRFPLVIYMGAAVLAHTAFAMLFHDKALHLVAYTGALVRTATPWVAAALVMAYGWAATHPRGRR